MIEVFVVIIIPSNRTAILFRPNLTFSFIFTVFPVKTTHKDARTNHSAIFVPASQSNNCKEDAFSKLFHPFQAIETDRHMMTTRLQKNNTENKTRGFIS
jgi:hypothetical protein